jgi:hypothetical protein
MIIPHTISGRKVGRRGVHLHPFGYHPWMQKADYWIQLMVDMGMSWVVVKSDSDGFRKSGAAKALLDAGIIPIVRFSYQFPRPWTEEAEVEALRKLYDKYNAPLIVQFANEPFDIREWKDKKVPGRDEAWRIIRDRWWEASHKIVERGGIAGFPDGPCYDRNPFEIIQDPGYLWLDGRAVYLGHFYGKGRPVDYPYDAVSQFGDELSWEKYCAELDKYGNDPQWNEGQAFLEKMNLRRKAWARPGISTLDDDTCFLGWEKVLHWSRQTYGFEVGIALTEGGWVPRDRPGGGDQQDYRWPMTTPLMVAKKTVAMYEYPSPLFAICPWLLADKEMGGSGGWEFDAWVGGAYGQYENDVVAALKQPNSIRKEALAALSELDALLGLLEV